MTAKIADIRKSYVNGQLVQGQGPPLAVENPATEETIAEVETLTLPQVEEAVLAARRAFDSRIWSGLRREERVEKVLALGEYLRARADDLRATLMAEAGAPQTILGAQVDMPLDHLRAACDLAGQVHGSDLTTAVSVAEQIRAGAVSVNGGYSGAYASSGGYKHSGLGRERGVDGIRALQQVKHLSVGNPS